MTGPTAPSAPQTAPQAPAEPLERALGHRFADRALIDAALTHPSVAGLERGAAAAGRALAYERLEFLGDRVLGLVIAAWLLARFPTEREGTLARRHAALVRREALGRVAETLGLGAHLRLSPGEAGGGGRHNQTILADACEAVIGALFLDGGLVAAERFIYDHWAALIDEARPPPRDAKTALQEWAQARGRPLPAYRITRQCGPAHKPEFEVTVEIAGEAPAVGTGPSRRHAEKAAATALLRRVGAWLDHEDPP